MAVLRWAFAILAIAIITAAGRALQLNPSTAGFLYLIVVLLISLRGGLLMGTIASVIATLTNRHVDA